MAGLLSAKKVKAVSRRVFRTSKLEGPEVPSTTKAKSQHSSAAQFSCPHERCVSIMVRLINICGILSEENVDNLRLIISKSIRQQRTAFLILQIEFKLCNDGFCRQC